MRIGVFTVLFQKLPFEAALDKIAAVGRHRGRDRRRRLLRHPSLPGR